MFSLPGLSLNPFAVSERKTVQYQLNNVFRHKTEVIIWHDAVNNSLTSHRINNYRALAFFELSKKLESYQTRLKATVYCPRNKSPNIFGFLKQRDVVTIHVLIDLVSRRKQDFFELSKMQESYQTRLKATVYCPRNEEPIIFGFLKQREVATLHVLIDLVSRRKQKDPKLVKEYYQLHQKAHLELKSLTLILTHQKSLRRLPKKTRHSKLNKRRRRAKKNKKLAAEAALTSSFH